MTLVPPGIGIDPADGGHRPGMPAHFLPGGEDGRGGGQHRIHPVGRPGGAGMIALAGDGDPPAAVREDLRTDPDHRGGVGSLQQPALLDVQFDEGADRGEPGGIGPHGGRLEPGPTCCIGDRDAVLIVQPAHRVGVHGAGHQPGTHAGQAESAAFLLHEAGDGQRPGRA